MNNTQLRQVLDHLKQFKTITPIEALDKYGCFRLSAVILKLRDAGYDIVTHRERNNKCTGTYARYEYRGLQR
ncbi:helix-turn-helix domain-containing protein [Acinetobacter sp. F9]|uniref:helix-turn-helix domain-containing protein n=1 Tax=Acinetobacter sp. F9 TaxID=2853158 RepID=UPI001C469CB2|nr:helix-turn-helix domain-containing protein [Acinetobacter sp. F9]